MIMTLKTLPNVIACAVMVGFCIWHLARPDGGATWAAAYAAIAVLNGFFIVIGVGR